ncbi:MAG: radical SAM protein [Cyanobacteriota bacterium]|nr:radical SAM protein [Cyanobacteriota bacterium]
MLLKQLISRAGKQLVQESVEALYLKTGFDATRPIAIRGQVNERCNYKCRYCRFWRKDDYVREMSIEQWQNALSSLKSFIGSYVIQFSGGEPFIKTGFLDLLEFCHREKIGWGVITNGSAFNRHTVERTIAARPTNIDISVDAATPDIHDFVRGVPGSLERITRGIELLRTQRQQEGLDFPIRIKPTVHQLNFRYLPQLVEWAQQMGATTIDFSPVRPGYKIPEVETELWLHDRRDIETLERTIETLVEMKRQGAPIETSEAKLRGFSDHFARKTVYHGVSPCRVSLREYFIDPTGNVIMCWFYPPIGNVKTQEARDIWYDPKTRQQRSQMVGCSKFGSVSCANSCLTHRSFPQEVKRGLLMLKRSRVRQHS